MERAFTKIKDVDTKILEELDDKSLFKILLTNRYLNNLIDENFWRRRLISKFPSAVNFKEDETWKNYYLNTVSYVDRMRLEYGFVYSQGNIKKQYELLKKNIPVDPNKRIVISYENLLLNSSKNGELALIKEAVSKGASINYYGRPLTEATSGGHLDIVKYLVEKGSWNQDFALLIAVVHGYLDIVKYLLEKGVTYDGNERLLEEAIRNNQPHIVEYLQSLN